MTDLVGWFNRRKPPANDAPQQLTFNAYVSDLLGLDRQSGKNDVLKFLGIGVAGLVLMLQAAIANRRAKALEGSAVAQADAVNAQSKATQEQAKANQLTEQGLRQGRLKDAIEHLGNESESVRLGGAYELFHLAQDTGDNDSIRQTVLDILCAHIRRTTGEDIYQFRYHSKPSQEIQSLLTLLFVQQHDVFIGLRINLRESWLHGAELRGARLQQADMRRVVLNKATLNDVDLKKAILVQTQLKEARLEGACLREADLFEVEMQGAVLSRAQLQGANVDSGRLTATYLHGAHLQGAVLFSTQMHGATLTYAKMQGAVLAWTYLQAANFKQASLQGAGKHDLDTAIPFADRIRKGLRQRGDLSEVVDAGLTPKRVDQLVDELLSPDKKHGLRTALLPYIGAPYRLGLPRNHGAVLGCYREDEAEEWIAEHEAAISATARDGSLLPEA